MSANDVYLVTLTGGEVASVTQNTFTYVSSSTSPSASAPELGAIFRSGFLPLMRNILSSEWDCLKMVVKNLFDNSDFEEHVFAGGVSGARPGEVMPFYVTLNFQSAKPTTSQDPARKLMGWLSNTDCLGQVIVTSGTMGTALTALVTGLGADLAGGSGSVFSPVITKRIPYITSGGKKAYRLPENSGEAVTFPAVGWGYDILLDHRVTRKYGRGI